jgi:hypothetical protein
LGTQRDLAPYLQKAIAAAKAGQKKQAREQLLDIVEADQSNEVAWFWLYQVIDRHDDKRLCLENLLTINPRNEWAQQELRHYSPPEETKPAAPPPQPILPQGPLLNLPRQMMLKLLIAFWLGISIIFIGGGIMASGEWLVAGMRSRTIPNYMTLGQTLELGVAIIFVIAGLISLNVTVSLLFRARVGFYGSIILALGMLCIGPAISLLTIPPNYLTLVCTGGISGVIILLTLASEVELKDKS